MCSWLIENINEIIIKIMNLRLNNNGLVFKYYKNILKKSRWKDWASVSEALKVAYNFPWNWVKMRKPFSMKKSWIVKSSQRRRYYLEVKFYRSVSIEFWNFPIYDQ